MATNQSAVPWRTALLVASGDLRESANQTCWAAQQAMEVDAVTAFESVGWTLRRAHPLDESRGHGFIVDATSDAESSVNPLFPCLNREILERSTPDCLAIS